MQADPYLHAHTHTKTNQTQGLHCSWRKVYKQEKK